MPQSRTQYGIWAIVVAAVTATVALIVSTPDVTPVSSVLLSSTNAIEQAANDDGAVRFALDIRPILSDRCFQCHGPDDEARQAELRLDVFEATGDDRGLADVITPGDSNGSPLMRRIASHDDDIRMPPPESKLTIAPTEIETVRIWIDAGATYEKHWAFIPPSKPDLPSVRNPDWCRTPIDRFVLARLDAKGLTPAEEADRETLIRRVSLDLTGIPPTLDEIDAFLSDTSPNAYERVVDRLLASPRYGERMASDWLDLARYADTYGYQSDVGRDVWPYRDWVIRAFNVNIPYDDFITWQLAGDLLPHPTREQRLATAFNRLHRQTNEGGSVNEEYRVEYVADRTHTMGTAFLGLTMECARCHDHKYDPVSQRDYYELFAFFNNIDESGLYSHFTDAVPTPTVWLPTPEQEVELTVREAEIAAALEKLNTPRPESIVAFEQWNTTRPDVLIIEDLAGHYPLDEVGEDQQIANLATPDKPGRVAYGPEAIGGVIEGALGLDGENNVTFPGIGEFTRHDPFTLALWIKLPTLMDRAVVLHRSRAWTDAGSRGYQILIEDGHLSGSLIHFWPGNALRVRSVDPLPVNEWVHIAMSNDGSSRADGVALYVNGKRLETETIRDKLTRRVTGGDPVVLTIGQRFRDRGFKGGSVDDVRVYNRCLTDMEVASVHGSFDAASYDDDAWLAYYLANFDAAYRAETDAVTELRRQAGNLVSQIPEIMAMEELSSTRKAHVLDRGRYDARLDMVNADTPAAIMPWINPWPRNRLGLARWMTHPDNPLTARVAVNRLWTVGFPNGLVETQENFGSQGTPPTHPELLDWLAVQFMESDWDTKALVKMIVTSATYRQSSRHADDRPDDPENQLLARGPLRRLAAETVRDQALFTSKLLVEQVGGKSVKPYQPPGLWQEKSGQTYTADTGDGLYRRSLYTYWKRTSPPPSMMIFDSSKRDVCVARRQPTQTPLQSLVLMNDPQFVEAARVLAEELARDTSLTRPADRISQGFRVLTGRQPTAREHRILLDLYLAQTADFRTNPDNARALMAVGESPTPTDLDTPTTAALAVVVSTIMNHDATVMQR